MIQINVNQVGICMIPIYRMFAPNIFNFKIVFALSIFENVVASKVFILTFFCAIPLQAEALLLGPGNLWAWDSDGF